MWQPLFTISHKWLIYNLAADILLFFLRPLEIYGFATRNFIYPFIAINFFVICAVLLYQERNIISLALVTLIFLVFSFVFVIFNFGLCRWGKHGDIYKNKNNVSLKLICKTFDCYGTAEDCRLYKQRELFKDVYWITKFEYENVDSTIWQRAH